MGRPTENPKNYRESFRLSENDMEKIKFCMKKEGLSKTDIVRMGIDEVYRKLKKQEMPASYQDHEHFKNTTQKD